MARHCEGPWYRSAKGTWYVWHGGRQVSLGVRGERNGKAATQAWHRLMAGVTDSPPTVLAPPVGKGKPECRGDHAGLGPTVRQLVDDFLADAKGRCKPESMAVYKSALTRFAGKFGTRAAATLRPTEAEEFANKKEWSVSTRSTFLSAIVTAFRWAVRSGLLSSNPLNGLRKPPCGSRGASAVINRKQFEALHAAATGPFRGFLMGLWLTGCRPGELAALRADDVDFEGGVATLTNHKTAGSTGRPRHIYLSPEAVKLFTAQADANTRGPLFRNSWGNAWNRFTLQKAMAAARKRAGLPKTVVCYGLRHSFATAALVAGIPDATVAALLGHRGTVMLHRHYSHLTSQSQAMRAAAAKVR